MIAGTWVFFIGLVLVVLPRVADKVGVLEVAYCPNWRGWRGEGGRDFLLLSSRSTCCRFDDSKVQDSDNCNIQYSNSTFACEISSATGQAQGSLQLQLHGKSPFHYNWWPKNGPTSPNWITESSILKQSSFVEGITPNLSIDLAQQSRPSRGRWRREEICLNWIKWDVSMVVNLQRTCWFATDLRNHDKELIGLIIEACDLVPWKQLHLRALVNPRRLVLRDLAKGLSVLATIP